MELIDGIFIGGKHQHGFVKNRSTATAGLLLQSLIARTLDNDEYVALASIDLSAAFDIPLEWLNLTVESFKVKCKALFL